MFSTNVRFGALRRLIATVMNNAIGKYIPHQFWGLLALLAGGCLLAAPGRLSAQTTAFTYQGRLTDNGIPANGSYDLRFTLYDAAEGGTAVSVSLTNAIPGVSNGLFTTTLDFGAEVFGGNARWLEIAARTNGADTFTPLDPRQWLTPAPTAIFAATAGTALTVSGTVPGTSLGGTYGGVVNFTNPASSFAGDGSGLVNVAGTLRPQLVSGNAAQAQPNTSYLLTALQPVTVTLPVAPLVGDVIRIAASSAAGWTLAQNPGQSVLGDNLANPLTSWTRLTNAPAGQGQEIVSSADGLHLIASYAGYFEISGDAGLTWSLPPNQPLGTGFHLAIAAEGPYAVAVAAGRQIYVSADFGTNWVGVTNSAVTNYSGVTISADGAHLAASVNGGGIYVSSDHGITWTPSAAPTNSWAALAASADGAQLTAAAISGGIYVSTNFGATWQPTAAPITNSWALLASSADGTRRVALDNSTNVWLSTDAGLNWQPVPIGGGMVYALAVSADGLRLAAAQGALIQTSTDGGRSWQPSQAPILPWRGVAASATGNFIATTSQNGTYALRTSTATGTPGYLSGGAYAAVELEYVGNGRFLPVDHEGTLITH